jgi:nicotinamidase-related amidase
MPEPRPTDQALLVMHAQPPITLMVADTTWIARIAEAIAAARAAGIPVIYVAIGYRPGHPEIPADSPLHAQLAATPGFIRGESNSFHPDIAPEPGDIEVITSRTGAFTGTDLELILRAAQAHRLVLTGISTGGVVLGTLVAALDRDFEVTVLSDAVTDANPETHAALLAHFAAGAPWKADVVPTAEWAARVSGSAS